MTLFGCPRNNLFYADKVCLGFPNKEDSTCRNIRSIHFIIYNDPNIVLYPYWGVGLTVSLSVSGNRDLRESSYSEFDKGTLFHEAPVSRVMYKRYTVDRSVQGRDPESKESPIYLLGVIH